MKYDAEWGVGGLLVFGIAVAFWSVWESEESSKKRLLSQKEAEQKAEEKEKSQ